MLNKLQTYYEKNGILSTSFTCKHREECSKDCENFTGPKSAFVSAGYESRLLPRLLFLSLDSGSGDKVDKNRLPYAVKHQEEATDVMSLAKSKHWFRTHELAWYILKRFNPLLKLEEAKGYFAHANSAKCCMNKIQRKKADKVLFKNCQKYLKQELEILNPEIVVTQGNEAKKAILEMMEARIKNIDGYSSIIRINDKEVFWLHTYHPSNYGMFYKHRKFNEETDVAEGWEFYAEYIFEFVSTKNV